MYKRKESSSESDSYVVIEIKDQKDCVYVQFVPTCWLKLEDPSVKVVARSRAQFYFPRRLPGQTKAQHLKFVKNAIFVCMAPKNDDKWELNDCRVLKTDLGE